MQEILMVLRDVTRRVDATSSLAATPTAPAAAIAAAAEPKDTKPRAAADLPRQTTPHDRLADSLAAVRALSEEEIIALFS